MLSLGNYVLLFQKGVFVFGAVLYVIFSMVVVKQVSTMSKNVSDKFNPILISLSYIHFVLAILFVLFTLTL